MKKRLAAALLVLVMAVSVVSPALAVEPGNTTAAPTAVLQQDDAAKLAANAEGAAVPGAGQGEGYSNDDSDIIRYMVYVETNYDTDDDGKLDLVQTLVQIPRAAAEGDYKAATIYEARPYITGCPPSGARPTATAPKAMT